MDITPMYTPSVVTQTRVTEVGPTNAPVTAETVTLVLPVGALSDGHGSERSCHEPDRDASAHACRDQKS
eukprot:4912138-Amphidinium_carterae.3